MKSLIRTFLLPIAGLALAATATTAAPWPPAPGDLILGVQATGGTGFATNVFFNLGPAHTLRDNPNPGGTLVNLDAELEAAFGLNWEARTDLFFGVIANFTNKPPIGLGAVPATNGDPGRTIYVSKGTDTPGTATPWSGYSVSALALAATGHQGQIAAIDDITANGNEVATLDQSVNPVQWNNGWSAWNPRPQAAYSIFTGGIEASINATVAHVDVFRIVGSTGSGNYVTTVSLAASGDVTAAAAGPATSYFTVSGTASNGSIVGADGTTLYPDGSFAKLTAVPAAGYGFANWSGDASGTSNPLQLEVDSNKNVSASFAPFPSLSSPTVTSITGAGATLGANLTGDGGQTVTELGVVYAEFATNANPTLGSTGSSSEQTAVGTGVFTLPVLGLTEGTTYAYKGYATTAVGTGYSTVAFFTTDTAVSLTGGIGTVTGRAIQAGDTQVFRFNLAGPSNAAFTTTGLSTASWELLDSNSALIDSGTGNVDFSELLTAGDYLLSVTNTGGTAETFAMTLDASNEARALPRVTVGPNAAANLPRAVIVSKRAAPKNVFIKLANQGQLPDTLRARATKGNSMFRVSYSGPGGNLTAALTRGAYTTSTLEAGTAAVLVRGKVIPNKRKLTKRIGKRVVTLRKTFNGTVTASATSGGAATPAKFQIKVK